MKKASDLFVECLENEGVKFIFGIPGEENLDILDSLSRSKKIKLILTRHEQSAGFMAATYGRLTGRVGVCLSTLGPGAMNLLTAAAYAYLGGMPLLMITGQKPVRKSKQGRFQILDVVGVMHPTTKYTHQIVNGDNIPSRVREAVRLAEEEKPGATHLELPEDIAEDKTTANPIPRSEIRRPNADDSTLTDAIKKMETAKCPILVIAAGANRKMTSKSLYTLIDKTGIPFVTTQMGKGAVDERHPCFIGNAALSAGDFVHRALSESDLIINIGHDVIEKPPFIIKEGGTEVIHINFKSAEVDPVYFPQIEVVGDISEALFRIAERITVQPTWDFSHIMKIKEALEKQIVERVNDNRFPMLPQRIVHELRCIMPDDGIITLDNGVYKIWFARNYKAHRPNTLLLDNALATMGAGLPSGMAARLVHKDNDIPIIAVCGDGGFMMNSQELETAVRLKLNLVVIILRDNAYGMIRWKQAASNFKDWGLEYGNPDFVKYAESYGAKGHRVTRAREFTPLVKKCLKEDGVHVIDCPIDYSENHAILNNEIKKRSRKI